MSVSTLFKAHRRHERIVVVLQADQAFWFKWRKQVLLDSYVETLVFDPLSKRVQCPWICSVDSQEDMPVELILNTTLDELDRVNIEQSGSDLINRWNRHKVRQALIKEHPCATVRSLPGGITDDAMSILHHVIPEHWAPWLEQLQKQNVQVSHVVTSTELLTDSVPVKDKAIILVTGAGGEERHLLVSQSVPVFMRIVSGPVTKQQEESQSGFSNQTMNEPDRPAVEKTIDYIREAIVGADEALLILQPEPDWDSPSEEYTDARILAALCVGAPVSYAVNDAGDSSGKHAAQRSLPVRNNAWQVRKRHLAAKAMLLPSIRQALFDRRISILKNATLVCALLAAVAVVLASFHSVRGARQRAQLDTESAQVEQRIVTLGEAVQELHHSPGFVTRSLAMIQNHQKVKPMQASEVLATVASAYTRFPALELNSLSWSTSDKDIKLDSTFTSLSDSSSRYTVWSEDVTRSQIQLELAGALAADVQLREQQQFLQAFVQFLENMPGVSDVTVLESPVQAARSSTSLSSRNSSYRLSLVMGRS